MSSDKSNQLLIREAIRKIALGRSMERISLAPGGMSGIGTARMVHGYVAKIHDNPSDDEFPDYGGTIDVIAVCGPRTLGQVRAYAEGLPPEEKEEW